MVNLLRYASDAWDDCGQHEGGGDQDETGDH